MLSPQIGTRHRIERLNRPDRAQHRLPRRLATTSAGSGDSTASTAAASTADDVGDHRVPVVFLAKISSGMHNRRLGLIQRDV